VAEPEKKEEQKPQPKKPPSFEAQLGELVPVQTVRTVAEVYISFAGHSSIDRNRPGLAEVAYSKSVGVIYVRTLSGEETLIPLTNVRCLTLMNRESKKS
jgi:hypothetical protein